ncbi:MAG: hypothetical protein WKF36_08870 [Candidatus Nitrosocosmicus sp.]
MALILSGILRVVVAAVVSPPTPAGVFTAHYCCISEKNYCHGMCLEAEKP